MPEETDRPIAELVEEAYNYGLEEGSGGDPQLLEEEAGGEREALEIAHSTFNQYTQYAHYCNTVLPKLRRMAGYEDRGHGTYQKAPSDQCRDRLDSLVEYFQQGWIDAQLEGTKWE